MTFHNYIIIFLTLGHSLDSMCFNIGEFLFAGGTMMQYEPKYDKRHCTKEMYERNVARVTMMSKGNEYMSIQGMEIC